MSKELQSQEETSPNCLGTIFGGSCTFVKRRNSYTQGSKTRKHSSGNDSLQMPSFFISAFSLFLLLLLLLLLLLPPLLFLLLFKTRLLSVIAVAAIGVTLRRHLN